MELKMYLNNQLIDYMPLNLMEITLPGYVGRIKRKLENKHAQLIKSSAEIPEYFVVSSSSMNYVKTVCA
jgi:hypothetical protein